MSISSLNVGTIAIIVTASLLVTGIGAAISFAVGRRHSTSDDWIVGGRSLPIYVVAFTQYATAVGGGVLVAHVGIAYAWGFSIFWYELFVIIGLLCVALTAGWLRRRRFSTVPEVFARLYGQHRIMTTAVALTVIVVPFGWLATQFVSFANVFHDVTGIGTVWLVVIMAIVTVLVVLPGGLTSVAWSDFFFGVFMIAGSIAVAAYAVYAAGGWAEIMATIPTELSTFPSTLVAAGPQTILLWLFAILPGTLTNQLYYQRIFAARSASSARTGIYLSCLMLLIAGGYALVMGLAILSLNPSFGVDGRELAAGWFLTQMPVWLLALFSAFLMATIVSTTGSALQSVVVNLVSDLRQAYAGEHSSDADIVRLSRWATVIVTVIAAALSIIYPEALGWLILTYAYSAAVLAVPLLLGMMLATRWTISPLVAYISMGTGLASCATAHIAGTTIPYVVFGILGSLIAYGIALAIIRPARRSPGTTDPTLQSGAAADETTSPT